MWFSVYCVVLRPASAVFLRLGEFCDLGTNTLNSVRRISETSRLHCIASPPVVFLGRCEDIRSAVWRRSSWTLCCTWICFNVLVTTCWDLLRCVTGRYHSLTLIKEAESRKSSWQILTRMRPHSSSGYGSGGHGSHGSHGSGGWSSCSPPPSAPMSPCGSPSPAVINVQQYYLYPGYQAYNMNPPPACAASRNR